MALSDCILKRCVDVEK